jgi:hypothetical protein
MNIKDLNDKVQDIITDLKNNGRFPKENNSIDYKLALNIHSSKTPLENFMLNFAKDILSFSNSDGGILLLGIEEKTDGTHNDVGLDDKNLNVLKRIDLNDVTQKFESITKVGVSIDLQIFQISTRKFYSLVIEKNNQILIPLNDLPELKIIKGAIYYRASSKNEHANKNTTDFNRFLQIKANERSKEFMEIWSQLLPEMIDINPREVLILNPAQNKVYGFNSKDKTLSGSDIEIDKTQNGVFNIILNAISAGEIGKITTNEGKPIYKIVGEIQNIREHIMLSNLSIEVQRLSKYKFSSEQLKQVMFYLKWVSNPKFKVENTAKDNINPAFEKFIWIEKTDKLSERTKVFFSEEAVPELLTVIDNNILQNEIYGKSLSLKTSV